MRYRFSYVAIVALGIVFFVSGCSQKAAKVPCEDEKATISKLKQELENRPPKVIEKIKVVEKVLEFPPNAEPGKCYARVLVPAKYEWVNERKVRLQQETPDVDIVEPKYEWVEEKVLVKDAVYKLKRIPPVYKTETKKVLVAKAHKEWKKFTKEECLRDPIKCGLKDTKNINAFTGEIMCLVEVPDLYKTVTEKILVEPAKVKKVLVSPPVYKTVRVKRLVREGEAKERIQPAIYDTVRTRIKVGKEKIEWKEIVCINLVTEDFMRKLQTILKEKGYYKGKIDGIYGILTKNALTQYQIDNHLSTGALTIETLQKLGFKEKDYYKL